MSTIYFHEIGGEACVLGSEQHIMGGQVMDALIKVIKPLVDTPEKPHWLRKIVGENNIYATCSSQLFKEQNIVEWIYGAALMEGDFHCGEDKYRIFRVALNTMMAEDDVSRFIARIHAQCEIHCYVEGKNRNWLAGIIEQGLTEERLRPNKGWHHVIDLLRHNDKEPVVCSTSITGEFPNPSIAGMTEHEWDELSYEDGWKLCMDKLREKSEELVIELMPDNWELVHFGPKVTIYDLKEKYGS